MSQKRYWLKNHFIREGITFPGPCRGSETKTRRQRRMPAHACKFIPHYCILIMNIMEFHCHYLMPHCHKPNGMWGFCRWIITSRTTIAKFIIAIAVLYIVFTDAPIPALLIQIHRMNKHQPYDMNNTFTRHVFLWTLKLHTCNSLYFVQPVLTKAGSKRARIHITSLFARQPTQHSKQIILHRGLCIVCSINCHSDIVSHLPRTTGR